MVEERLGAGKLGTLAPGIVVGGRYRIVRALGTGARGVTFEAEDIGGHGVVALKVLHPAFGEESRFREAFERTAANAASLRHPNLATVLDFGLDESLSLTKTPVPWITSELVIGSSLRTFARALHDRDAELRFAIEVLSGVLGALWFAHRNGLVHGDLRPTQVFDSVEADGSELIKVLDFGIAHDAFAEKSIALPGDVVGDPGYMSPEEVGGAEPDERSDLYAAGCLAFYLFTRQPPFPRPSRYQVLSAQVSESPPLPSALVSYLPSQVDLFLIKSVEKDPAQRFQTGDEMLDRLHQVSRELELRGAWVDPRRRPARVISLVRQPRAPTIPPPRDTLPTPPPVEAEEAAPSQLADLLERPSEGPPAPGSRRLGLILLVVAVSAVAAYAIVTWGS